MLRRNSFYFTSRSRCCETFKRIIKLTVFSSFRHEFLAVRNAEGGFFLCQAIQNVYKSSPRIRIRWLSEQKENQTIYDLDFYDATDIECVLTTVSLNRMSKNKFELTQVERDRIESILKKALDVEKGVVPKPDVTEENPDGRKSNSLALFL